VKNVGERDGEFEILIAEFQEGDFQKLKWRLPQIHSLAMLKMEKNFIAVIEKGYPRQPYANEKQTVRFLIHRIEDELEELKQAYSNENLTVMKEECADISNIVDYLFEKLCRSEIK